MSSLPHNQQTNRHLGTRLSQIENATKFKTLGHMAPSLRVEFTLTEFQKSIETSGAETNYSCSQNFTHKQRKHFNVESYLAR